MKTAARNRKDGRSTVLGKEMFFGYSHNHMNESCEGFCRRGRGRSFIVGMRERGVGEGQTA